MDADRRRQLLLVLLLVVLGVVAYQAWSRTADPEARASNRAGPGGRAAAPGREAVTAPDVKMEALEQERPKPGDVQRNLFRFQARVVAPPPRDPSAVAPPPPGAVAPPGPPPPPAVPPIPLRYIGYASEPGKSPVVALVDDQGNVFTAVEGQAVDGRYVILRVGADSVDIAHVDGRGRQRIPLSNQNR